MQRRLMILMSAFLLSSGLAHADTDSSRWDSPKNEGPHLYDGQSKTQKAEGVIVGATWLFWTAHQSNSDYVFDGSENAQFKHCDYDWDHGIRLEGGAFGEKDAWGVRGQWTHIEISGRCDSVAAQGEGFRLLNPLHVFMDPAEMPLFTHAQVRRSLQQNLADLQLERPSFWSQSIVVTPLIGARYWNLEQFNRQRFASGEGEDADAVRCQWSSKLNGWGIHGGARSEWHMGWNFSILGELGASVLAANSRDYLRLRSEGDLGFEDSYRNQRQKTWRAVPGINLGTGIQWEHRWAPQVYCTVKAVYELHQWFNLSRKRRYAAITSPGMFEGEEEEETFEAGSIDWIATGYADGDLILFHGGGLSVVFHF